MIKTEENMVALKMALALMKKKKQTKQKTTDLKDGCSKFEQKYKH